MENKTKPKSNPLKTLAYYVGFGLVMTNLSGWAGTSSLLETNHSKEEIEEI